MKNLLVLFVLLTASPVFSQHERTVIPSIRYSWSEPVSRASGNILSANIFKGKAYDFAYMQMDACSLPASSGSIALTVPVEDEYLFIIKSGVLNISFADSSWYIGPGSIALLLPGEKFAIQSTGGCRYYHMKYRSKEPADPERGVSSGGSFVKDWNKLRFRTHDRGGVRAYFERPTTMSKRFEMHVTTLKPGLKSHDPHTHEAEEIILMLEDGAEGRCKTEMLIGENSFAGEAGDLYYVGSNLLHGIKNTGAVTCSYFAFQFE